MIGAARRRGAVRDGDHRQPGGRQAREVAEQAAAAHEILDLVVPAGWRRRSRPGARTAAGFPAPAPARADVSPGPWAAARRRRCRCRGADHRAHARTQNRCRRSKPPPGMVMSGSSRSSPIAGHRGEFEKGGARVEQQGDALARQQLAALVETRFGGIGAGAGARLQSTHFSQQTLHMRAVGRKTCGIGIYPGFDDGHGGRAACWQAVEKGGKPPWEPPKPEACATGLRCTNVISRAFFRGPQRPG